MSDLLTIIVTGPPGSGKTTLADVIAASLCTHSAAPTGFLSVDHVVAIQCADATHAVMHPTIRPPYAAEAGMIAFDPDARPFLIEKAVVGLASLLRLDVGWNPARGQHLIVEVPPGFVGRFLDAVQPNEHLDGRTTVLIELTLDPEASFERNRSRQQADRVPDSAVDFLAAKSQRDGDIGEMSNDRRIAISFRIPTGSTLAESSAMVRSIFEAPLR